MMPSEPRRRRAAAPILALALAALPPAGCGGPEESARMARRTMTVAEVPDGPRAAAAEALPGIDFEEAWANVDAEGRTHSFEIRGRAKNGRIREVRVSPEGEVLEME